MRGDLEGADCLVGAEPMQKSSPIPQSTSDLWKIARSWPGASRLGDFHTTSLPLSFHLPPFIFISGSFSSHFLFCVRHHGAPKLRFRPDDIGLRLRCGTDLMNYQSRAGFALKRTGSHQPVPSCGTGEHLKLLIDSNLPGNCSLTYKLSKCPLFLFLLPGTFTSIFRLEGCIRT